MYKGEADWQLIGEIAQDPKIHIPIFGNGDINSPEKAALYKDKYGVQGIMIGRAAIGYPWIFREIKHYFKTGEHLAPPTIEERVAAAHEHLTRSIDWKGERVGVVEMRRHYTNYFKGLPNVKQFRQILVTEYDPSTLFATLEEVEAHYAGYEPAVVG